MNNYLIPLSKNIIKFCDRCNDPQSFALGLHIRYCPLAIGVFRCFINIQKDANEPKLTQAWHMKVAIYTCIKFAVHFVYLDTNNSVRSWQVIHVLIAVTHWVERTDFDHFCSLVLFNRNMPKSMTGFSHAPLETAFTLHRGNTAWPSGCFSCLS